MAGTAVILGTGLIGCSIGIGLRTLGWKVSGWDPDAARLRDAVGMGALDDGALDAGAAESAELVVLAGPVNAVVEQLMTMPLSGLVIDVAGVKQVVVDAGAGVERFVGTHPMAGRETSGPEHASGSLFHGATWVLTIDNASEPDLGVVERLVEDLGANPVRMSAADHDRAVALASHLPHLLAAALVNQVAADPDGLRLAAGGFRDLTRVAMSDPGWWVDVLTSNRAALGLALRQLASALDRAADRVEAEDVAALAQTLTAARNSRQAMAAPVETVGVVLRDEPGEIARVGHSLSESGVDLRDLQLRHAVHGGGGVLTLSVRRGEAEALRAALRNDGFQLLAADPDP